MEVESLEVLHFYHFDPQQVLRLQARLAPVQVVDDLRLRLHREEGGGRGLQEDVGVELLVGSIRHRLYTNITLRPDGPQLERGEDKAAIA